jgi:hypothetical protein
MQIIPLKERCINYHLCPSAVGTPVPSTNVLANVLLCLFSQFCEQILKNYFVLFSTVTFMNYA